MSGSVGVIPGSDNEYPLIVLAGRGDFQLQYFMRNDHIFLHFQAGGVPDEGSLEDWLSGAAFEVSGALRRARVHPEQPSEIGANSGLLVPIVPMQWESIVDNLAALTVNALPTLEFAAPVYTDESAHPDVLAVPDTRRLIVRVEDPDQTSNVRDSLLDQLRDLTIRNPVRELVPDGSLANELANELTEYLVVTDRNNTRFGITDLLPNVSQHQHVQDVEFDWILLDDFQQAYQPADELWSEQWSLQLIGADRAWEAVAGSPADAVTIAVLDSGFDTKHPDLNFTTPDLYFSTFEYMVEDPPPHLDKRDYSVDSVGWSHGTAVCGVIAAKRDNKKPGEGFEGIAGIASGSPIMPIRMSPYATAASTASALLWAVSRGARVSNMSFAVGGPLPELEQAIRIALKAGMVLCAAAGNYRSGDDSPQIPYPAAYPDVLAIGATTRDDRRKERLSSGDWGSCFGPELDAVAPGVTITTTDESGQGGFLAGNYVQDMVGTSIAVPHMAGLAAFLYPYALQHLEPEDANAAVIEAILRGCKRDPALYQFQPRSKSNSLLWNKEVGHGRVDCAMALRRLAEIIRKGSEEVDKQTNDKPDSKDRGRVAQPTPASKADELLDQNQELVADRDSAERFERLNTEFVEEQKPVKELTGYFFEVESPLDEHSRLYLKLDFSEWLEIRTQDILYWKQWGQDHAPHGYTTVWVEDGDPVKHTRLSSARSFIQGQIARRHQLRDLASGQVSEVLESIIQVDNDPPWQSRARAC